jgi:hypothetical protein
LDWAISNRILITVEQWPDLAVWKKKELTMSFEQTFQNWIEKSLSQCVPDSVKAFAFNLFETDLEEDVAFGIGLVGAGEFNEANSDWACNEVWEPFPRDLNIPVGFSGDEREECLQRMKALLIKLLSTDSPAMRILKSRNGIAIGFVDGDLEVI